MNAGDINVRFGSDIVVGILLKEIEKQIRLPLWNLGGLLILFSLFCFITIYE